MALRSFFCINPGCRAKESEQMKDELMQAREAEKNANEKLMELSRTPIPVSNKCSAGANRVLRIDFFMGNLHPPTPS